MNFFYKLAVLLFSLVMSQAAYSSEWSGLGKILSTQGHYSPNCRTVRHQEAATGIIRAFRISDIATDDDISAVVLSALMSNRDVNITFDSLVTTGCGTEPRISYITIQ